MKEDLDKFYNRLKKIGVEIELIVNYPWVYLGKVNGKKVRGVYQAEHGFTVYILPARNSIPSYFTDLSIIFKKIRETLNQ